MKIGKLGHCIWELNLFQMPIQKRIQIRGIFFHLLLTASDKDLNQLLSAYTAIATGVKEFENLHWKSFLIKLFHYFF